MFRTWTSDAQVMAFIQHAAHQVPSRMVESGDALVAMVATAKSALAS